MPNLNQESAQVAAAIDRLSVAMEQLQNRYEASERSHRRLRISLLVVLILMVVAMYRSLSPLADQLSTLPQIISQALPGMRPTTLDPEVAAAERRRLMDALSPQERARIEDFESKQQWISDYIAASAGFDPGATIALFLSNMAGSVAVMPDLYTEVSAMTEAVRNMNGQIHAINEKMDSLPVLATEVSGMHAHMSALPVLASDVKAIHFYMSGMARDMDSTLGEAGRMLPWNW